MYHKNNFTWTMSFLLNTFECIIALLLLDIYLNSVRCSVSQKQFNHNLVAQLTQVRFHNMSHVDRPISQIPECIRQISHNAPFCNRNVHTCAHFCYKMLHCGIWHRCILGFVRWVYLFIWNALLRFWMLESDQHKNSSKEYWETYSTYHYFMT